MPGLPPRALAGVSDGGPQGAPHRGADVLQAWIPALSTAVPPRLRSGPPVLRPLLPAGRTRLGSSRAVLGRHLLIIIASAPCSGNYGRTLSVLGALGSHLGILGAASLCRFAGSPSPGTVGSWLRHGPTWRSTPNASLGLSMALIPLTSSMLRPWSPGSNRTCHLGPHWLPWRTSPAVPRFGSWRLPEQGPLSRKRSC